MTNIQKAEIKLLKISKDFGYIVFDDIAEVASEFAVDDVDQLTSFLEERGVSIYETDEDAEENEEIALWEDEASRIDALKKQVLSIAGSNNWQIKPEEIRHLSNQYDIQFTQPLLDELLEYVYDHSKKLDSLPCVRMKKELTFEEAIKLLNGQIINSSKYGSGTVSNVIFEEKDKQVIVEIKFEDKNRAFDLLKASVAGMLYADEAILAPIRKRLAPDETAEEVESSNPTHPSGSSISCDCKKGQNYDISVWSNHDIEIPYYLEPGYHDEPEIDADGRMDMGYMEDYYGDEEY